jgi:hypothetical protein
MGRAALGAAAKSVVGSTRMTQSEAKIIIAKYGSVARFLRMKLDEELQKELSK